MVLKSKNEHVHDTYQKGNTDIEQIKNKKKELADKFIKKNKTLSTSKNKQTQESIKTQTTVNKTLETKYNKQKQRLEKLTKENQTQKSNIKKLKSQLKTESEVSDSKIKELNTVISNLKENNQRLNKQKQDLVSEHMGYVKSLKESKSALVKQTNEYKETIKSLEDTINKPKDAVKEDAKLRALRASILKDNSGRYNKLNVKYIKSLERIEHYKDVIRELNTRNTKIKRTLFEEREKSVFDKFVAYTYRELSHFKVETTRKISRERTIEILSELKILITMLDVTNSAYNNILYQYRKQNATNLIVSYNTQLRAFVDYTTNTIYKETNIKLVNKTNKDYKDNQVYTARYIPFTHKLELLTILKHGTYNYNKTNQNKYHALNKVKNTTKQLTIGEMFELTDSDAKLVEDRVKNMNVLYVADKSNRRKQMMQGYGINLTELSPYEDSIKFINKQISSTAYDLVFVDLGYINHGLYYNLSDSVLDNENKNVYSVFKLNKEALLVSILSVMVKKAKVDSVLLPPKLLTGIKKSIESGLFNNKSTVVKLDETFMSYLV